MGKPIPEIRTKMVELAAELSESGLHGYAKRLRRLANQTFRNPPVFKKGRNKYPKMTRALAKKIYNYKLVHPGMHNHEVAQVFKTNPGRVTDAYRMMGLGEEG